MAEGEDKNKTIFSISEGEEVPKGQERPMEGVVKGHPVESTTSGSEPVREEKPSAEIAELEEDSRPGEISDEIEHEYEVQVQSVPEPTPVEEKEPKSKGFLSSLFGGGRKVKEAEKKEEKEKKKEKEEKPAAGGRHLTDIVQSEKEPERKEPSGGRAANILSLVFLAAVVLLIVYSLIIAGPVVFIERATSFPQWFPQVFEYWFENNIYPVLEPLVGRLVKELGP